MNLLGRRPGRRAFDNPLGWTIWLSAVALVFMASCASASRAALRDASTALREASTNAHADARHHAAELALERARARLHAAISDPTDPANLRSAFIAAARAGDQAAAARIQMVWRTPAADPKARIAAIQLALLANHFDSARSLAWDAAERMPELHEPFIALWVQAHALDPRFAPQSPRTLRPGEDLHAVEHLGGGSSITLRFLDENARPIAAFKPHQTRLQSSYRGELAAYRLCPLIQCGFEIPRNQEVRIARSDLLALAGRHTRREIAAFDRQYRDLIWTRDAEGETWLYGTQKDWVPAFRRFTIERRSAWRELVQVGRSVRGTPADLLNANLTAHRRSSSAPETERLTFEGLGRQLSNLHVFDYLTNNWDRYSRHYEGVNCQWRGDHFLSIDNGAAFGPREVHGVAARRVRTNLGQVERFSRRTVLALRWMQPALLYSLLFPPTDLHDEKAVFADFVERRRRLLAYVDEQILAHGKQAVIAFD